MDGHVSSYIGRLVGIVTTNASEKNGTTYSLCLHGEPLLVAGIVFLLLPFSRAMKWTNLALIGLDSYINNLNYFRFYVIVSGYLFQHLMF